MKCWRLLSVALLALVSLAMPAPRPSNAVSLSAVPYVVATVTVGDNPRGVAVDEMRNLIYVTNHSDSSVGVSRIDGYLTASSFSSSVANPIGVAVDSANNRVLVTNSSQPVLSVLNGADGSLLATPQTGMNSHGIAYDATTGKAYVASLNGNILWRVNLANNEVGQIGILGQPAFVALNPSLRRAYVTAADRQTVAVVDLDAESQIAEYDGFGHVAGIAVNPTNGDIYVVNAWEGAVSVRDKDGNSKGVLNVDIANNAQIRQVAINPNTGHVFVTRFDNASVYVFEAASVGGGNTVSPIAQLAVGGGPEYGLAVNSTTNWVYVANSSDDSVTIISDLPKAIGLSANSLSFLARTGGNASSQDVLIYNTGGGPMNWTASPSYTNGSGWLTVTPNNGTNASWVTIGTIAASLGAGTYDGMITFSSTEATNSPQVVNVRLSVTATLQTVYLPVVLKGYASAW